jgi:hypothetical protein
MYGRRDERHPVATVRLRESFLPYHYDLYPSPLSEVDRETLFPPLSVNRNQRDWNPEYTLNLNTLPKDDLINLDVF